MEWKDATRYRQSDKERIQKSWETKIGKTRVYVTCGHIYYAGEWIVTCRELGIKEERLHTATSHDAKEKALRIVKEKAELKVLELEALIKSIETGVS